MRILAIDPSSTCMGLYDGTSSVTIASLGDRPKRLAELATQLVGFLQMSQPDVVVYEEQFVRGRAATVALYGAVGLIEATATQYGAAVIPAPQATLRKWCQGKVGKIKDTKELMQKAASHCMCGKSNVAVPQTEHEWDAAAIYYYAKENVTRGT
jgi:Holliday junction resolvasome RuvABC endonuclease subunit